MRTLKRSRWSVLFAGFVALLLLSGAVLSGCGKNENNNDALLLLMLSNKNVAGYWEITSNNGVHNTTSYMSLSQSDTTVTGGYIIPGSNVDTTQISGVVSGSTVTLSYTDANSTRTFTGTVALFGGSISGGTWSDTDGSSGTWSATSVGNVAVVSGSVGSFQGQYMIGLTAGGPKTQTLASMTAAGPNIANQAGIGPFGVMVTLSATPAVGDVYTATLNYSDSTSETMTYTVDSVFTNAPDITSPANGANNVSTTPTFTFQLGAGTAYYGINLMCGINTAWSYEALPSKTSISFNEDGTATGSLGSGDACILLAVAYDSNGNSAMSSTVTFTIQ